MPENPEPPPVQTDFSQPPSIGSYPRAQADSTMNKLIPTGNPPALIAYYLAIFGLIPGFCLFLSPAAIVLGFIGLKKIRETPGLPGKAHAMVGIILGGIVTLICLVGVIAIIIANLNQRGS